MIDPEAALRDALAAAGLSLQAIPEEQRAMLSGLTEEEVTRLIMLRTSRPAGSGLTDVGPAAGEREDATGPDTAVADEVKDASADGEAKPTFGPGRIEG